MMSENTPKFTRLVVEPGENSERDTGYKGYPDRPVIAVPIAPTRRFLQASGPRAMRSQLREWGCAAHIERAELGTWEVTR